MTRSNLKASDCFHRAIAVMLATAFALTLVLAGPAPARAVTRAAIISRAQVWVARDVPYSTTRYATVSGSILSTSLALATQRANGYRTDCSGFASMCLGLRTTSGAPYSPSTATIDNVLIRITKAQLRPGDVILRPSDLVIGGVRVPYGHAVIFGGWVDSAHTKYVGYHESSSAGRAIRAVITWGTSGFYTTSGFAPYRYRAVRDRVRLGIGSSP